MMAPTASAGDGAIVKVRMLPFPPTALWMVAVPLRAFEAEEPAGHTVHAVQEAALVVVE